MQFSNVVFLWSFKVMADVVRQPINLEGCIYVIANLPDFLMEYKHGIYMPWGEDAGNEDVYRFFNHVRFGYRAMGKWLEYYLLDRDELKVELKFTDKAHYKPLAERCVAVYRLAQEILIRPHEIQHNIFAGEWMTLFERDLLTIALKNSGLTGDPKVTGKSQLYREMVKNFEYLSDTSWWTSSGKPQWMSPWDALISEAIRLSHEEPGFEEEYYLPFCKKIKQCQRKIKQGKLSGIYISQAGELKVVRTGKRPKISKGFGDEL